MLRRISTKWVLTVLAAVLVPFLGYAWFVDVEMANRQWDMVRYYLLSIAGDMAERLDNEIRERRFDIELWTTTTPLAEWTITEAGGTEVPFHKTLELGFDQFIKDARVYDLILAIDANGRLVVSNNHTPQGTELPDSLKASLRAYPYEREAWFQQAMAGATALVDHHQSPLLPPRTTDSGPHPENYHIGFAVPVHNQLDHDRVVGVVYGLMNWSHIQTRLLKPQRPKVPGIILPDIYHSCYAWLWMSDADTIIGHPMRDLYLQKVSAPPINLPELVQAARSADQGMYPEYTFRGVRKSGAFKHCASRENGGLGWIVGVGVDNDDITATIDELRTLLFGASLCVFAVVIVGTVLIARHTTRPILALEQHTRRVAAGDLSAQVVVKSKDELGELARAFNTMTHELSESRAKLVKAEKDAAWREMARQVAHEIKNPLTPISLSAALLKRAKDENSPEYEAIFERTIDLIQRQVEHMRLIAADFSAFAGARKSKPEVVDVRALVDEVLALNAAWAKELSVRVVQSEGGGSVFVDRGELRRVLINLVSNALEAMPDGGTLAVAITRRAALPVSQIVVEIRDTGGGLSDEARRRLFEPYFTTRTHGTGLGLAIAARLVDEMSGRIELVPASGPTGAESPGTGSADPASEVAGANRSGAEGTASARTDAGGTASDGAGTIARVTLPEHRI
jgi:signal transduction histidine kinase